MDTGFLVPLALFAMIGTIAWVVMVSIQRLQVARLRAGMQARVLDRLPSADSLIAYAQTESGREFVTSLLEERAKQSSPYKTILHGVHASILFTVLGLTVLLLARRGPQGFAVIGTLAVALGVGFALTAGATWLLSSRFGLLTKPADL